MITGRGGKIDLAELIKLEDAGGVITTGWGVPPENKLAEDVPLSLIKVWRQKIKVDEKVAKEIRKAKEILRAKEIYNAGLVKIESGSTEQGTGRTQENGDDRDSEIGGTDVPSASPTRTRQLGRRAAS